MDVVTLLPSATEIVTALGVDPVATSHECDYPPRVEDVPDATVTPIDPTASSQAIDEQVARAEEGAGVFDLRADLLERLGPDVVVTQGICDVCAVDSVLVEDVVASRGIDAAVVTTDPHHLADLYRDIERIGQVLGRESEADDLVRSLRERVDAVAEQVEQATAMEQAAGVEEATEAAETAGATEVPNSTAGDGRRPTVAVLDWLDPVMVAGHWVPDLVEIAGGTYPLADPGERSRPREWAEIQAADPDVLVAAPCGFEPEQTRENLSDLTDRAGWADLSAVHRERAFVMDGHHYVNRPGPRLVETLELLAAVLHPDRFDPPDPDALERLPEAVRGR